MEAYLSHFDAGELSYLKNITLTGLTPGAFGSKDPFVNVDLSTYIQAEWMAVVGEISNTTAARARVRSKYRMKLAWDATPGKIATLDGYFQHILPHRLEEPDFNDAEEERLGAHWIMLKRLYANPKNAPTLPELDAIGEGEAWLPN
jgi:hypothetical protein